MTMHSSKVRGTIFDVNTRFLMLSSTIMESSVAFYEASKRLIGRQRSWKMVKGSMGKPLHVGSWAPCRKLSVFA